MTWDAMSREIDNLYRNRKCPYCGNNARRVREGLTKSSYICEENSKHTFERSNLIGHMAGPAILAWKIFGGGN